MRQLSDLDTTTRRHPMRGGRGLIAISGLKPRDRRLGKVPLDYVRSVRAAGGEPVVLSTLPLSDDPTPPGLKVAEDVAVDDVSLLEEAAGLVLTGGGDVDPEFFGQDPHPRTYNVVRRRDIFEFNLLEAALRRDMPVLAICRGMQVLNVYLGGTLQQHIMDDPGRLDHGRDRPRAEIAHGVSLRPGSALAATLGKAQIGVNSHHHQALDRVAAPLEEVGWADDGIIEAVCSTEHRWVVGVQWHPEAMTDINDQQLELFRAFVEETKAYRAGLRSGARSA